jgi:chitodextrinase
MIATKPVHRSRNLPNNYFAPWDVLVRRILLIAIATFSLFCSSYNFAKAQSNQNSPLGTVLSGVSFSTSEQPFLNIFKTGQGWETYNSMGADTGEEVALYQHFLDANGNPTIIAPGGAYQFTQAGTVLLRVGPSGPSGNLYYPAGNYVFLYDGIGTFTFSDDFAGKPISSTPGRIVINVPGPTSAGTIIRITSTGSGSNYAKNFRLIYSPDSTAGTGGGTVVGVNGVGTNEALLNSGEIFNPTFISRISPFRTLRFVEWMTYNQNFQRNWSDRHLPSWQFYADSPTNATINGNCPNPDFCGMNDGVPAEVMFALCNKISADCWFNMPALAGDDYVTQFATLAHSSLNSNLKVYVEYANELWNQALCQASGTMTQSCLVQVSYLCAAAYGTACPYPSNFSTYQANTLYGQLRTIQVGALWKAAWGVDASRVIRVFGGWNGYTAYNSFWLSFSDPSHYSGTVASNVDALAVAPYFGYPVPNTFTLDQLFQEMMSGGLVSTANGGYPGGMIAQTLSWAATNYAIASSFGLPLISYEGGQTFVDYSHSDTTLQNLYAAANRDPRMGTAYTTYLNGWKSLGGTLFNNYKDVATISIWGYWGALENVLQTSSPKYDALTGFIVNNPCWWSGCSSTSATPTTTPSTVPPTTPTGLSASVAGTSQINTSWIQSSAGSNPVAGYNVFRNGSKVGTTGSTSYQDPGLSAGTTYTYAASAFDTAGNTSAQSSPVSATIPPSVALPSVTISSPTNGATIQKDRVHIVSSASDATGINSITITGDSRVLKICSSTTSCSTSWAASKGTHIVTATAVDKSGLQASTSVTILALSGN